MPDRAARSKAIAASSIAIIALLSNIFSMINPLTRPFNIWGMVIKRLNMPKYKPIFFLEVYLLNKIKGVANILAQAMPTKSMDGINTAVSLDT